MKKYKTLLFDVDDTLLDFQKAEKVALRVLFEEKGIPLTDEIEARYKKINKGLWDAFEKGELSRNEVVNTRFFDNHVIASENELLEIVNVSNYTTKDVYLRKTDINSNSCFTSSIWLSSSTFKLEQSIFLGKFDKMGIINPP